MLTLGNGVTQLGVDAARSGILRENCHDQDNRQCPGKDTLTPDGVGPRRTRDTLFNGVVARAHCARFKSNSVVIEAGNGASKRGSPGQCELVGRPEATLGEDGADHVGYYN